MSDLDRTLRLAKAGSLSRAELYAQMQALAVERREPGQSTAQAFVKFVTGEGVELMRVHSALGAAGSGNVVPDYAAASPSAPATKSAGSGDWHDLVEVCKRAHKRSHPRATDRQANAAAVNAAMSTPGGLLLFKQQKRTEQTASGLFTTDDMKVLDGADAELQLHADMHKRANQHMSEFEHLVADAQKERPHLTESAAGDFVRSTEAGRRAWEKHKGVPGRNGVEPEQYRTSGPGPQMPPPQWNSPNATGPVTPARTPERPSETPAVKAWNDLKRKAMFDYGYPEQKTVEILKVLPEGRRAIARVIEEAEAACGGRN